MNPLQLLDDHLVKIGSKLYPKSRVDKIYNKLSNPSNAGEFYQGNRVIGNVSPGGEVSVSVKYPDVYQEDLLYKPSDTQLPAPVKELGGMMRQFNNVVEENPGLYYSRPVSGDGMRLSQRMGFEGDPGRMFIDNRRFRNLPAVNELLGYGDAQKFGEQALQLAKTPEYFTGINNAKNGKRYSLYDLETLRNGGYIGADGFVYDADGDLGF